MQFFVPGCGCDLLLQEPALTSLQWWTITQDCEANSSESWFCEIPSSQQQKEDQGNLTSGGDTMYSMSSRGDTMYNLHCRGDTMYTLHSGGDTMYSLYCRGDTMCTLNSGGDTMYSLSSGGGTIYYLSHGEDTMCSLFSGEDTMYSLKENVQATGLKREPTSKAQSTHLWSGSKTQTNSHSVPTFQ